MVLINFYIHRENFSLKLKGHAAYNVGNDIVCSAVSSITETLILILKEKEITEITREPGNVEIKGKLDEEIRNYLYFACTGYKAIANTYPENVSFKGQYTKKQK